ncbi:MAG: CotH kinase family protein [Bacteroidales bacterium]|nr:CotH kinase family protein [Bacteroidales bacterium]
MRHSLLFALSLSTASLGAWADSPLQGAVIGTTDCYDYSASRPSTTVNTAANLFDGDPSTFFATNARSYTWAGLDLGEPHVITRVGWMPRDDVYGESRVVLAMFEGANSPDFMDAIPIYLNTERGTRGQMSYADVDCSRGFRYVRYVGPNDARCNLAELEFYGYPAVGDDSHLYQLTNLPMVVVNTVDQEEPYDKEHEITANIIIIDEEGAYYLEKEGGIRERGNGSRQFPKKPWRIKFAKKQSVLDAPAKAKKWTLINNYGDKTLMRNRLAFDIAERMGMEWVPYCRFVDVVLNGEYKGCYQLCDQVEVNEGRLEIDEMTPEDVDGEALTGGYFVEVDAYADEETSWFTTSHYHLPITIKSPDEDEITPEQSQYIEDYFNELERLLHVSSFTDPEQGYRQMLDTRSFIQHMLVNEVAGNTDTYWSTYMYKRRSDPLIYTGPVWDFDLGFDNDYRTYHVYNSKDYLWDSGNASSAEGMRYFAQRILKKDTTTAAEIQAMWQQVRDHGLTAEWLNALVDAYAEELDASQRLNFMRWPILSEYVHMNPVALGSYNAEVRRVKDYVEKQMAHLDKVIGYDPELNAITTVKADESTDGPVEYFTPQGVRTQHLVEGQIYIRRQGNKVDKIRR